MNEMNNINFSISIKYLVDDQRFTKKRVGGLTKCKKRFGLILNNFLETHVTSVSILIKCYHLIKIVDEMQIYSRIVDSIPKLA